MPPEEAKEATGDKGGLLTPPPPPRDASALSAIVAGTPAVELPLPLVPEPLALAGAVWERNCMDRASARIVDES